MPKMVDMMLAEDEIDDMAMEMSPESGEEEEGGPRYPYGLCIHLDDPEIQKLGLGDADVGDVAEFHCKGRVKMKRVESDNTCLEIQIEQMGMVKASKSTKSDDESMDEYVTRRNKETKKGGM